VEAAAREEHVSFLNNRHKLCVETCIPIHDKSYIPASAMANPSAAA
jgi:hypothetical protein